MRTLLVDNHDSYTYNLFQLLAEVNGAEPLVLANDDDRLRTMPGPGIDDAVIVDAGGAVVEGSTTSLLWWRGDTLCLPPSGPHLLDGVTRRLILARAARRTPVVFEQCRPEDLDHLEVWAVNALHGIRPVTRWIGVPVIPADPSRAQSWSASLDAACEPVWATASGLLPS